jgi:hypothetical protein
MHRRPPKCYLTVTLMLNSPIIDDIYTYLSGLPIHASSVAAVHASSVAAAGGAVKYWYAQEKQPPTVASMVM